MGINVEADDIGVTETVDGGYFLLWSRTGRTVSWSLVAKSETP